MKYLLDKRYGDDVTTYVIVALDNDVLKNVGDEIHKDVEIGIYLGKWWEYESDETNIDGEPMHKGKLFRNINALKIHLRGLRGNEYFPNGKFGTDEYKSESYYINSFISARAVKVDTIKYGGYNGDMANEYEQRLIYVGTKNKDQKFEEIK